MRVKAGSPPLCALTRTPLRFTRFYRWRDHPGFGYASPAQAAEAVPAPPKTRAVAV